MPIAHKFTTDHDSDKNLADTLLRLGVGEFDRGHGCPDGYVVNQNIHPLAYFVRSPVVAMEVLQLVIARYWQIHPSVDNFGQYLCMVVKVQGTLRSSYESPYLEKAIILACVDALTTDEKGRTP